MQCNLNESGSVILDPTLVEEQVAFEFHKCQHYIVVYFGTLEKLNELVLVIFCVI